MLAYFESFISNFQTAVQHLNEEKEQFKDSIVNLTT